MVVEFSTWWRMQIEEVSVIKDMLYTAEGVQSIADQSPLAMKASHLTGWPRTCLAEAGIKGPSRESLRWREHMGWGG